MSQRSIFEVQADLCRCMASATRIGIVHLIIRANRGRRSGGKNVQETQDI
jgi:hypothetical protein